MLEMIDVEDGELIEDNQDASFGEGKDFSNVNTSNDNVNMAVKNNDGSESGQRKNKKRKKKKRKRGNSRSTVTDINRFVTDACRRLKERKSYLVWLAVGRLGISALNDLLKQVDAVQAHGVRRLLMVGATGMVVAYCGISSKSSSSSKCVAQMTARSKEHLVHQLQKLLLAIQTLCRKSLVWGTIWFQLVLMLRSNLPVSHTSVLLANYGIYMLPTSH